MGVRVPALPEPEAFVEAYCTAFSESSEPHRQSLRGGRVNDPCDECSSDLSALKLRRDHDFPNMNVCIAPLHANVATIMTIVLQDLERAAIPVSTKELILNGRVPLTELTDDNLMVCFMMDLPAEINVVDAGGARVDEAIRFHTQAYPCGRRDTRAGGRGSPPAGDALLVPVLPSGRASPIHRRSGE